MEIKVKQAVGTKDKTTSQISLTKGLKITEAAKEKIKQDVGDFLTEQILSSVRNEKSPVDGEDWPKLSRQYKKKKIAEGLIGEANLEESGDMLDALEFKDTDDGIEIGFWGKEAAKADGHNNFSGDSGLAAVGKQRRFLPDEGQEFVPSIQKEIEKIIADDIVGELQFDQTDFEDVGSKAELYAVLEGFFADLTRAEIRQAVARTPDLITLLDDMSLLDYL